MLWVDKYSPRSLDKVTVHEEIAQNLKNLVSEQDCPHLLFYGPSGSGKKTLIMALLKEMFGASAEKLMLQTFIFTKFLYSVQPTLSCQDSDVVSDSLRFGPF
ncbi:hypothetical protein KSP40_PGU002215 [Platanthera guangdongensis]|uniref:Replication factor C subunit 5 n=1 Tax=Platanthera guangdongensis TaxID=2320717 RepID=A0ABR2LXD4_9ASPA